MQLSGYIAAAGKHRLEELFGKMLDLKIGLRQLKLLYQLQLKGVIIKGIAKVATSSTGRFALKTLADTLGEGAEEYISEVAGRYLKKLYDENIAKESFGETFINSQADAFKPFLLGSVTSFAMNAGNINTLGVKSYENELQNQNAVEADRQALINAMKPKARAS